MTFDVHIEYRNGQETWVTVNAETLVDAVQRVTDEQHALGIGHNIHEVIAHAWGTRPGFKRQGR